MILRRLGNKKKLAKKLYGYFPYHKIRIITFFGAGGDFFYMPKAKYNIVNDNDSDVFNLFQVVMNRKEELEKAFYIMPIHADLLEYWKKNKETDPIKKALRFLLLSNFTYLGSGTAIQRSAEHSKNLFYNNIDKTFEKLYNLKLFNLDCIKFLNGLPFDGSNIDETKTFIYNDPLYLDTFSGYENKKWTKKDFIDLLDCNIKTGCKFAVSEFDNEFVISEAKKRGLNVIIIGERQNLKNRRTEILITNYTNQQKTIF